MSALASRSNPPGVLPASIVAAALVVSALIVATSPASPVSAPAVKSSAPPIPQGSARDQFRSQTLAAPILRVYRHGGATFTLTDVHVTQVIYTPKDDAFTMLFDWVWSPAMPSDGPNGSSCTLTNDGYGHYFGPVVLSSAEESGGNGQFVNITIK